MLAVVIASSVIIRLISLNSYVIAPKSWMANGSFFWNQLVKIKPLFHWCAHWLVGDSKSISYWYDSWHEGHPIRALKDGIIRPRMQGISLREMLTKWPLVLSVPVNSIPVFNDQEDLLIWRWSQDGRYSSASVYKILSSAGKVKWRFMVIWRSFAPSKVRIFTYLLLHNRLLTREGMPRRNMNCDEQCPMCSDCQLETAFHLIF